MKRPLLLATSRPRGAIAVVMVLVLALAGLSGIALGPAHAGPGAHGPGGEHLDAPAAAAPGSGLGRLPDGSVNVPKPAQRRMGVRTVLAPESEASATLQLPGRVVVDPNASGRVQAVHGGRIEPGPRGLPIAGQPVRRGEVLGYVRHHADPYEQARQRAQESDLRTRREIAEQRLARLRSLEGTVPRKEIDALQAEMQGLRERERGIGASLAAREPLVAPVAGVIARADARAGQVVEARDLLFEVVDPARVLVEATTPDATLVSRIAAASLAEVPGVSLRVLGAARVLREGVLPITFAVRGEEPGAPLPLAIGQPVTLIATLAERTRGIVLPARAIVRNPANESVVWIKTGAERFVALPVQYRPLDAATVLVTSGLAPDNRVVVEGAPLIAQIR